MNKRVNLPNHIILLLQDILNAGDFEVETYNESVLVELMRLNGTPIRVAKNLRNSKKDLEDYIEENKLY